MRLRVVLASVAVAIASATIAFAMPSAASATTTTYPLYQIGGIGCDGLPVGQAAGTVVLTRSSGSLDVTITVADDAYPSTDFSVEAWEEAPGCYPDNALAVGAFLATDAAGSGSTSFTLPMPFAQHFPNGSTVVLGDGAGTENLVVVLDRTGSQGAGDSYGTGPIPIPPDPGPDPNASTPAPSSPPPATTPPPVDTDGDGVLDATDACPDSYPGYPVDSAGCAKPLRLDWTVPKRFTGVPATTAAEIQPDEYPATVTVTLPDGLPCDRSFSYEFVGGVERVTSDTCTGKLRFAYEGTFRVTVNALSGSRLVAQGQRDIRINDILIVSLGDSVASGEGNKPWQHAGCHRSSKAGPLVAARRLEDDDPRSSVTVIHLACSGATVLSGILYPQRTNFIDAPAFTNPKQIEEAVRLLNLGPPSGRRTPDAVLISLGANDIHFAEIASKCVARPGDCRHQPVVTGFLPIWYQLLAEELARSGIAPADKVYLTTYFNPLHGSDGSFCRIFGMSPAEAQWAEETVVNPLNAEVRAAANRYGWNLIDRFDQAFMRHGYCVEDPEERWIRQLDESIVAKEWKSGAFHPDEQGHEVYGEKIEAALKGLLTAQE